MNPLPDYRLLINRRQFFGRTATGIGTLALGDVLRQHELHALAVAAHQDAERAAAASELDRFAEVLLLQVRHEGRRADQVGHALLQVARA